MPPGRVLRRKKHTGDSGCDGAAAKLALSMGGVVTNLSICLSVRCFLLLTRVRTSEVGSLTGTMGSGEHTILPCLLNPSAVCRVIHW